MYYENESANDRQGKKECVSECLAMHTAGLPRVSRASFQVELRFPDVIWSWAMRFQVTLNSRNTLVNVSIRKGIRKN